MVCFPTKWGKWREREDFKEIINCRVKGNVENIWVECMQIGLLASLTWQGLFQHANPCSPSNTSVSISPSSYYPQTTPDHFTNRTSIERRVWLPTQTLPSKINSHLKLYVRNWENNIRLPLSTTESQRDKPDEEKWKLF